MAPERRHRLTPAVADVRRAVRAVLPAGPEPRDNSGASARSASARSASASGVVESDAAGSRQSASSTAGSEPAAMQALVLVALSGGADSLALAAALAFEAPRAGCRGGAVIVDHALQAGSADSASTAARRARDLGLDPVQIRHASVVRGEDGPEAEARRARYAELDAAAIELDAAAVLLGHTLDDQAETVLLGLARGSGAASLHGMAERSGIYARPLLGIRRASTRQACLDAGLTPWDDPQNENRAFARVRVRDRVLPVLEAELGPGIAEALARTADALREDADALDDQVLEFIEEICEPAEAGVAVSVGALEANPAALRQRVIRYVVQSEFGTSISRAQTLEVARLVTHWRGQKGIDLPGARVRREGAWLMFHAVG